jgi:integral membrane sensor domain MASE1
VARVSWPGWVIAGGLALLLATTFLAPLPVWMQVLAVVGPLIGGLLADMLVRGGADGAAADARA